MDPKTRAALSAVHLLKDGQTIGLGTGSTVGEALREIARRIREEGLDLLAVPTSVDTQIKAIAAGIPLTTLDEHPRLEIAIDGADEVDRDLNLIKGGGGALTREKIVASASERFVVIVDERKLRERLCHPVPVEVLPFARRSVEEALREMGGTPLLRTGTGRVGPVLTDNGNYLLDVDFGEIPAPGPLEERIDRIPGVVENGIFAGWRLEVHVGTVEGVRILHSPEEI
jgi:ribose 5-phosphate isomerase A